MISYQTFLEAFFKAIENDTPETDLIALKKLECRLLHDLELDLDLFEDIMIYELVPMFKSEVDAGLEFNIDPIVPFLPHRIGLLARVFNRVPKKYFSKYAPLSIEEAAKLIYEASLNMKRHV